VTPRRPAPRRLRRAAIVLGTALVALSLLEGGSRLLEVVLGHALPAAAGASYALPTDVVPVFRRDDAVDPPRFVRTEHHWIPAGEQFVAVKGPRTFRVFCLGGSAAQGWPHHPDAGYPRILEAKLRRLLPGWTVEVVNAAGNTYGSHRVRVVLDEVLAYQPDLVVLYTGNNELVERVVAPLGPRWARASWCRRLATCRLARRALAGAGRTAERFSVRDYGPDTMVANRLRGSFGHPNELRTDPELFALVGEHFRANLAAMAEACRRRGVPLVLLTAPVNLKDWRPCTSFHRPGLAASDLEAWQSAFRTGVLAREAGRDDEAVTALERAAAIDPQHAETWFELGAARHRQGRWGSARDAFLRAVEWDGLPVRSLFNPSVRELAATEAALLVDIADLLERQTADGIAGFEHLVDYVHPTVAANEVIAHEVARALTGRDLLPAPPAVPLEATRIPVPDGIEEELWTLRALFGQYLSLRQFDGVEGIQARIRREAEGIMAEDPSRRPELEALLARVDAAVAVVTPYRRAVRAEKLGLVGSELTPEQARSARAAFVELVRATEAPGMPPEEVARYLP